MAGNSITRAAVDLLAMRDKRGRARGATETLADADGGGEGKARLMAWVHGVVRRRRSIHALVGSAARRSLKDRAPNEVAAIELGAFRVLWSEEPAQAVADDVSKFVGGEHAAHVERVVLAVGAAVERFDGPLRGLDGGDDRTLPTGRQRTARLRKPLLEVSGRNLAGKLGVLHSLPDMLVTRWQETHGDDGARALAWAANDPAPLFARANPLRTTREALIAALAEEGVTATAVADLPLALRLEAGKGTFHHTGQWRRGELTIQDLTAQRCAPLLAPVPGERLLDLCAAPGTKTAALAELARDQAPLLACDRSGARLRRVELAARGLGLASIQTASSTARAATSSRARRRSTRCSSTPRAATRASCAAAPRRAGASTSPPCAA